MTSRPLVADVMLRHPKTLSADASIAQARAVLQNDRVHMVLLTEHRTLVGTLIRTDLPSVGTEGPALAWSRLVGRTVPADASATVVHELLNDRDARRLAVVDAGGTLLGLLCLKQHRTGFCADRDVAARSAALTARRQSAPPSTRTGRQT